MNHDVQSFGLRQFAWIRFWLVGLLLVLVAGPTISRADLDVWKVPSFKAKKKNPIPADKASLALGKQFYLQECLACHGQSGRGDGPGAKDLEEPPGDLTSPELWSQSDGALFFKITVGRRPMPSFREKFKSKQRWDIINYVRTMTRTEASPRLQVPASHRQAISVLLEASLPLHAALAEKNLDKALAAKQGVMGAADGLIGMSNQALSKEAAAIWTHTASALKKARTTLEKADQMQTLRKALRAIAYPLNTALTEFGHAQALPVYLFHCRAALGGKGAIWLQADATPVRNPYLDKPEDGCAQLITKFRAVGK